MNNELAIVKKINDIQEKSKYKQATIETLKSLEEFGINIDKVQSVDFEYESEYNDEGGSRLRVIEVNVTMEDSKRICLYPSYGEDLSEEELKLMFEDSINKHNKVSPNTPLPYNLLSLDDYKYYMADYFDESCFQNYYKKIDIKKALSFDYSKITIIDENEE